MSNVIDLASRRQPEPYCCPRHELDALADRIQQRLDDTEALLIPRTDLAAALADLEATTERLLPRHGREHHQ